MGGREGRCEECGRWEEGREGGRDDVRSVGDGREGGCEECGRWEEGDA